MLITKLVAHLPWVELIQDYQSTWKILSRCEQKAILPLFRRATTDQLRSSTSLTAILLQAQGRRLDRDQYSALYKCLFA